MQSAMRLSRSYYCILTRIPWSKDHSIYSNISTYNQVVKFRDEFDIKSAFGKRVTITSAIPYVNGVKHLGNLAGSMLPADIFHRFLDLFGVENIFICGTDDHGTAVEIAAQQEGLTPQEFAQKYYAIQKEIYKQWHFDFTHFGFSSSPTHHEIVKQMFIAIHKNGYIKKQELIEPFCLSCRRSLPD